MRSRYHAPRSLLLVEEQVTNEEIKRLCDKVIAKMDQQVERGIKKPSFIAIVDRVIGFAERGWDTRKLVIDEVIRRGWTPKPRIRRY